MSTAKKNHKKNRCHTLPFLALSTSIALNTLLWVTLAIQISSENKYKWPKTITDTEHLIPWKRSPMTVVMDLSLPGSPISLNRPDNTTPAQSQVVEKQHVDQRLQPTSENKIQPVAQPTTENTAPLQGTSPEPHENCDSQKNLMAKDAAKETVLQALLKKQAHVKAFQEAIRNNPMDSWKQHLETKNSSTFDDIGSAHGASDDARFLCIRKRLKEHFMTSLTIALRHASLVVKKAVMEGKNPSFDVVINADGTIARLGVAQPSGCDALDELVIRAIETAAPFPPLPKHLGIDRYPLAGAIFD